MNYRPGRLGIQAKHDAMGEGEERLITESSEQAPWLARLRHNAFEHEARLSWDRKTFKEDFPRSSSPMR